MKSSSAASSARSKPSPAARKPHVFTGIGVSPGIALGPALLVGRTSPQVQERAIPPSAVDAELAGFRKALKLSEEQLEELKSRVAEALGEKDAGIFDAHLLLLTDSTINDDVEAGIRTRRRNADFLYWEVINRYMKVLQSVEDPYIKDRTADIRDVAARVISNIRGEKTADLAHLQENRVIVAHDLSPSDSAYLHKGHILGFVTCVGSRTSHSAIVARSFGIPAVVGICDGMEAVRNGDSVIVDGYRGFLIVHPSPEQVEEYQNRLRAQEVWFHRVEEEAALAAETIDGFRVQLAANIELPEEVEDVKRAHGVGIGLFRTEYLFVNKPALPDEDAQFEAYRKVAEAVYPESVIIRTLDIGGDKFVSHLNLPSELNPFLGIRAIRFSLSRPDLFLCQLRAILRASAFGKIRIMFPMISTLDELLEAIDYLKRARKELDVRGVTYNRHMDVGMMIEVPSAALLADHLAQHVDFFSIGTNDLVQYSVAADRSNPAIAYLSQPCHPAIVRLLREVAEAACCHGIWVSVCGEMAGEPVMAPLLLGLGIQELSMSHPSIGPIKRLIRRTRIHEAAEVAQQALRCSTASQVRTLCEDFVRRVAPDVLGE